MAWVDANCPDLQDGGHLSIMTQAGDLMQATSHGRSKEKSNPSHTSYSFF